MIRPIARTLWIPLLSLLLTACNQHSWQAEFEAMLKEYGHRNWIVVADYAYPAQSASGITTVYTHSDHGTVLDYVLQRIGEHPHVYPVILLDQELEYVEEKDAPGVDDWKTTLGEILNGSETSVMPHEEIIRQLDEESALYRVMILKTKMTIPYSSVFMKLDCAYWGPEKESRMRTRMAQPE